MSKKSTKSKQKKTPLILDQSISSKLTDKIDLYDKDSLKSFVGKRQSRLIRIETYNFNQTNQESMLNQSSISNNNNNNNSSNTKHEIETNAMTMQNALETAYNDWNKDKIVSKQVKTQNEPDEKGKIDLAISAPAKSIENETKTDKIEISSDLSEPKINSSTLNSIIQEESSKTTEISFYYGNPSVDIVKGFIHIYKDS